MAVSAFKSTSKRGNLGTSSSSNITSSSAKGSNSEKNLSNKAPLRRSRSVSAVSRSYSSSSVVDFLNKRDNPLFCSTTSSPPDILESENLVGIAKFDENASKFDDIPSKLVGSGVSNGRRGRSVSRNSECGSPLSGTRKVIGRSLSRVDTGRRQRSVSRGRYENSESENDNKYTLSSSLRNKNNGSLTPTMQKKVNAITSASEPSSETRTPQTWSSQHPLSEPFDDFASYLQAANWEDGISTSSFSEAEEKTIKAVIEQMESFQSEHPASDAGTGGIYETVRSEVRRAISEIRIDLENAIGRKNPTIIAAANVADNPPELVNPDAIELVSDIRREYAAKLEQSHERARKLRADLAVEEHRGQELSRILKEILPEPKTSEMPKSRSRRKTSIERRKMSKRLTEEAMNYFDECVSISTFDGSDFSSLEDPLVSLATAAPPVGESTFFPSASSSASANYCINGHLNHHKESDNQVQSMLSPNGPELTASSSSKNPSKDRDSLAGTGTAGSRNFQFCFADELTEAVGIHDDIRNYIKKFEKEIQKDSRDCKRSSYYNADDYELQVRSERLLFDRVILKNRIESGGLLLCGTGVTI